MKKNLTIPGLLMVVLFISCEREDKTVTLPDSTFYAITHGEQWISTSSYAYYSITEEKFFISGLKGDSVYYEDEHLHFSFKKADIPESDTVTEFYSQWNYIVGGDAISDTYMIDSIADNWIKIISLDTINRRISGTFKINLVRDKLRSHQGEKKQFQNGYFTMNYDDVD